MILFLNLLINLKTSEVILINLLKLENFSILTSAVATALRSAK